MANFEDDEPDESDEGAPAWIVTFADLMSLLLTFFVLLLSFANTDTQKFRAMLGSIREAFGSTQEPAGDFKEGMSGIVNMKPDIFDMKERERLDLIQELRKLIGKNNLNDSAEIEMEEDGVRLRIKGQAMFETGSADLSPKIHGLLDDVKEMLDKFEFPLIVEGHTDNVPMKSEKFPSNWELSAARAISVTRYYMEKFGMNPEKLTAIGYASTKPLVEGDSPEVRAKNRRVEFKFKQPQSAEDEKPTTKPNPNPNPKPKITEEDLLNPSERQEEVLKELRKEKFNEPRDVKKNYDPHKG